MKKTNIILLCIFLILLNFSYAGNYINKFYDFGDTTFYKTGGGVYPCYRTGVANDNEKINISTVTQNRFNVTLTPKQDFNSYCLITNIDTINAVYYKSQKSFYITNVSLEMNYNDGITHTMGLYIPFNETYIFNPDVTKITLYNAYNTTGDPDNKYNNGLILVDENGYFQAIFDFRSTATAIDTALNDSYPHCVTHFYNETISTTRNSFNKLTLTPDMYSFCNITESFNTVGFILFSNSGNTLGYSYRMFFDDINFTLFNGTNYAPEINITQDINKVCVDDIETTVQYNFTINSYDAEGDTILYSYYQPTTRTTSTNVYFEDCWFSLCTPDFSFTSNIINNGNDCEVKTTSGFDSDYHYLYGGDLIYNGLCAGNDTDYNVRIPALTYSLEEPIIDIFYATKIKNLASDYETFNLTFYDETLSDEIIKLMVNVSNGYQHFYSWNGTDYIYVGNKTADDLEFSIKYYGYSDNITMVLLNEVGSLDDLTFTLYGQSNFNLEPIAFIRIEVGKFIYNGTDTTTVMAQEYFSYAGNLLTYNFTTEKKNNISVSGTGITNLNVYYTDASHIGSPQVKTIYFNNEYSEFCIAPEGVTIADFTTDACSLSLNENAGIYKTIVFFLHIPYKLMCVFSLEDLALTVGFMLLLFLTIKELTNNDGSTFKTKSIKLWVYSLVLFFTGFLQIWLFILMTLLTGMYNFSGSGEE